MIGQYDAAVIDKEDGKPHVVKRMDRPHIRVIPEWFGGGSLPRKELHKGADRRGYHRRNHQRAAGSAQELTLPVLAGSAPSRGWVAREVETR
jgi:hypothetical protein